MTELLAVTAMHYLFSIPLSLLCLFLILLVLVQRGRGGGLTGALGGMGGQSAFGTKAGDVFTRITIVVAAVWILLSMAAIKVLTGQATAGPLDPNQKTTAPTDPGKAKASAPATDDAAAPATGDAASTTDDVDQPGEKAPGPVATPGPSLPPEPEKASEPADEGK